MDYLEHSGVKRKSGRFEYGTGENPYQHEPWFEWGHSYEKLKESGMSEQEISKYFKLHTQDVRARYTISINELTKAKISEAIKYKNKGMSNYAIAEKMGTNEATIRNWLKPSTLEKAKELDNVTDVLKKQIDKSVAVDVGKGIEIYMGIPDTKLNAAINKLEMEGYVKSYHYVNTAGNKQTTILALSKPLEENESFSDRWKEIENNKGKIKMPVDVKISKDGKNIMAEKPTSLDSSRIKIVYAEEGGKERDGLIQIRRGVKDVSLGNSQYAQVRILVDDKYYMKGMAVYSDDLPKGVDVVFNSNKSKDKGMANALKKIKDDPEDPFGATVTAAGQTHYIDDDGHEKLGVVNKIKMEDDWSDYKKNLASQFLAKQSPLLAKQQLDIDYSRRKDTLENIKKIQNPIIKEQLLLNFAGSADTAAVELKAAALPRQAAYVLLPVPSLKDNEIYAPKFKNGEEVVLVRYPHGGIFEIPRLVVNNNNKEANGFMRNAVDAVGISGKTAEILSGADFDGDTALVIPTNGITIKNSSPLPGLKGFDPEKEYPKREGMKVMKKGEMTQKQMGMISNLITDMTIAGATPSELTRAVKHSMVVIDAAKHEYDYMKSYEENRIEELHKKYQGKASGGAQTLLSRSKSPVYLDEFDKTKFKIDENTGKIEYMKTGKSYVQKKYVLDKDGNKIKGPDGKFVREIVYDRNGDPKIVKSTVEVPKMAYYDNAEDLISYHDSKIEHVYADYANSCKALANEARKEFIKSNKKSAEYYSPTNAVTYQLEVASLMEKMAEVDKNAPVERQAQLLKDASMKKLTKTKGELGKDEYNKILQKTIKRMRDKTGAHHRFIDVNEKEWEAINKGAVKKTLLKKILSKMDGVKLNQYVLPKESISLTQTEINRIKSYNRSGFTIAEIAEALNISTSTVSKYIKE